ncbi:hypothetical protein GOP47_0006890 [Adiantum capillus-veneris]|uniref:Uncharacterized protein n=1 Tax=Adiantum capillus-veneris TaxID=13818 RepID=A0A9D4V453_ADICA|nr:hypothetical protein GOP47_0006890 [Adiantum capillus-veneris]
MGNLSSSSCSAAPTLASTIKSSAATQRVSRVLLIDGSMLKFRSPIKVIHLLLDYPNHVICPLDSLTPGLHSLSTLLPDEQLQLGRLYLLLPFKTHLQHHQQTSSNKSIKQAKRQHTLDPKMLLQERGVQEHLEMNSSLPRTREERILPAEESGSKVAQEKQRQGLMGNADLGSSKFADSDNRSEVGLRYSSTSRRSGGKLSSHERRGGKESSERGNAGFKHENIGPLCDTPELQRAYRSFLLRRSSTWTPRLQPILERR